MVPARFRVEGVVGRETLLGVDTMKSWMVGAVALLGLAVSAPASVQSQPEFSWTVGAASDHVFRGSSQTEEGGQVFGGVDVTAGDFYAGASASAVDYSDSTDGEIDFYAGFRSEVQGFEVDLGGGRLFLLFAAGLCRL